MHERPQQRECRGSRIRIEIQHLAGGEILAGLGAERGEISVEPAARDQQGNAPRQPARDKHHAAADHRARDAAADAIEQHQHEQRHREPHGLRSQSDAERGEKRADHDHAARCRGHRRRQPPIAVRTRPLFPPRRHQARLRGERRGQPGQIAHRPDAEIPEQRTRHGDRGRGERFDVDRRPQGSGRLVVPRGSCRRTRDTGRRSPATPASSDNTASDLASIVDSGASEADVRDRLRRFSERDVDGIAGRMGPVCRDVEVANAEREIDRVDVFERRRQERHVREREDRAPARPAHALERHDTGRRRSASFRLPRR